MPDWIVHSIRTQRMSFVLFDQFSNQGFANALEPLRAANTFLGRSAYEWRILTLDGRPVKTSANVTVVPDGPLDATAPLMVAVLPP